MTNYHHHRTLTIPYQTDSNLKLSIVTFDDLLNDFNFNNYINKLNKYDFNSQLKMYGSMPLADIPVLPMNEDVIVYLQHFHKVDENLVIRIVLEQLHSSTYTTVAYLVRTSPILKLHGETLSESFHRGGGVVQERKGCGLTELINEEVTATYDIKQPTNKYRHLDELVRIDYLFSINMYETNIIVIINSIVSTTLLYSITYTSG